MGIKAGNQTKQEDRLVISSRDALELVQLITGKMSDRQCVYMLEYVICNLSLDR